MSYQILQLKFLVFQAFLYKFHKNIYELCLIYKKDKPVILNLFIIILKSFPCILVMNTLK